MLFDCGFCDKKLLLVSLSWNFENDWNSRSYKDKGSLIHKPLAYEKKRKRQESIPDWHTALTTLSLRTPCCQKESLNAMTQKIQDVSCMQEFEEGHGHLR